MNGDEDFQSSPKAMTVEGRDGIIARIFSDVSKEDYDDSEDDVGEETEEVKDGMIVLFSHPPEKAGIAVILEKFEVRDSKSNPGKKYIKCFQWIKLEDFERIRNAEMTKEVGVIWQEQFKKLAEAGVTVDAEIAEKLLVASQNEVFASLLIKSGAKAAFWNRWNFLVITGGESVKIPIVDTVDAVDVHQSNNIISFDADSWKTSDDFEAVIINEIPLPSGNQVTTISSGKKNILLIPKEFSEIAVKLKRIAESKLSNEMKEDLIKEVLKQMKRGEDGE